MNSEEKIYSKIKNASQNGEKDFPGMDKVWNRVEEKLDNTIVVKKKNTWQKVAIAASVLLSFSIIYNFLSNDEIIKNKEFNFNNPTENPIIVSNDSVKKIMEKANEVVVENTPTKKSLNKVNPIYENEINSENNGVPSMSFAPSSVVMEDAAYKMEIKDKEVAMDEKISPELIKNTNQNTDNEVSFKNSSSNSSSSNNGYLAPSKKYNAPVKETNSKYKAKSAKAKSQTAEKSDDIIVVDGVVVDKRDYDKINGEDVEEVTHFKKPLYIINGIEYSEESLFGKKPTSPYAPLDKQEIITFNVIKEVDAMKVYGKKGENGVIIITTKDGKPVKK